MGSSFYADELPCSVHRAASNFNDNCLVAELQGAIDRIRAALHAVDPPRDVNALEAAIEAAIAAGVS